jgi:hypothetical protein
VTAVKPIRELSSERSCRQLKNIRLYRLPARAATNGSADRSATTPLSRADMPENERRDFHVYLDEFQNFTTLSLAGMLSELRKWLENAGQSIPRGYTVGQD